jgi:hypothetical protein
LHPSRRATKDEQEKETTAQKAMHHFKYNTIQLFKEEGVCMQHATMV